MTQEANNSSVRVKIFGQEHTLCGSDPDYILQLAEHGDSMIRAVAETHTDDNFSLAVLAALNIADEYHRLKAKLEGGEKETSSEEETTEEADSSDSLVGEVGQPRKPFTKKTDSAPARGANDTTQNASTRNSF